MDKRPIHLASPASPPGSAGSALPQSIDCPTTP